MSQPADVHMIRKFFKIHDLLVKKAIQIINRKLFKVVESFNFVYFSDKSDQLQIIHENMQKSKVIIINQFKNAIQEMNDLYFIIVFSNTIMILNQSSIPSLNHVFLNESNLCIVYLPGTKNILPKRSINHTDKFFEEEISNFIEQFFYKTTIQISTELITLWDCIQKSIAGYLIQQSYQKINLNRIDNLIQNKGQINSPLIMNSDDYISLRIVGIGSNFIAELIYHIETGDLFVIKKPNSIDNQFPKLIDRQLNNYTHLEHPFFARFIGLTNENKNFVVEYIDGQSLNKIENKDIFEEKN